MNSKVLSISQLAQQTGLTAHTLRYYETAGILQPVSRLANGHRRYAARDVLWLAFVLRLKATGMPLAQIREYARLRADGDATLNQRLTMLQLHRERLLTKLTELQHCAIALDEKIRLYAEQIAQANGSAPEPEPCTPSPSPPSPTPP